MTPQIALHRITATGGLKQAQRALWSKLAVVAPVTTLLVVLGVLIRVARPDLLGEADAPDTLLPAFAVSLPTPLPGLFSAAVVAATASSLSASFILRI